MVISEGVQGPKNRMTETKLLFQRVDMRIDLVSQLTDLSPSLPLSLSVSVISPSPLRTPLLYLSVSLFVYSSEKQTTWLLGSIALNWKMQLRLAEQQNHSLPTAQNSL